MTVPLRVALILPSFAGGGAERVMLHVAACLDRSQFAPALIVLDAQGPLAATVPEDVPVTDLGTPRLRQALPALHRTLRQARPDAVLSTMGYLNLAVLAVARSAAGPHCRVLVREANRVSATLEAFPLRALGRLAYRLLYRRADAVLCNAGAVAAELAGLGVPPARIHLVDNPVDSEALRRCAGDVAQTPGRFVASGRLTRQKGFDRLIAWFAQMPETAQLTIFGDGPDRAALQAQIDASGLTGQVVLPGYVAAPWRDIAGADAFLMSSRWEGMPNAALEALALGTPVIACREAGGLVELCQAVPAGRLTIAEDRESFIAAMGAALRTGPGVSGLRASALPPRFGKETVVARYAALIAGKTGGKGRG
jgi:glycosyltransferase involved in cell wall biosynthesis